MTIKNKLLKLVFFVVIPLYAGYLQYMNFQYQEAYEKLDRWNGEMRAILIANDSYLEQVYIKDDYTNEMLISIKKEDFDKAASTYEKIQAVNEDLYLAQQNLSAVLDRAETVSKEIGLTLFD